MTRSFASRALAGTFSFLVAAAVLAADSVVPDDKMWLLPPFCHAKLGGVSLEQQQQWKDSLGETAFAHIHHYCWAIYRINYLANERGITPGYRATTLNIGSGDIDYVLDRTSPDFPLRYPMLVLQAQALAGLKRDAIASRKLQEAIALRPAEEIAYFRLAQLQISMGATKEARETIRTGLQHKPDSPGLQRLSKSLSSKGASTDAPSKSMQ